jgi:predicted enzyme related to lactoylglutathione lyase
VAGILRAGGRERMPPTDIPGVGRFALLADPLGVDFYVMRGASDGVSNSFDPTQPGHCQWNELTTPDQAAALDFYLGQFGWEKGDAMPMGALGDYRFLNHGGRMIGAMMNRPPEGPPPAWNFYFGVTDIDAAAAAVTAHGGVIRHGPMEVPGGLFSLFAGDPQGALFGLVGQRRAYQRRA